MGYAQRNRSLEQSAVFLMMPEKDHEDIILIAIMDMMYQHLKKKNSCNESRLYRLERMHEYLLDYEETTYQGSIPEAIGDRADRLNETINAGLHQMTAPVRKTIRDNVTGRFRSVVCAGN